MYSSRLCNEYLSGVLSFINVAESNMKWQKMTYMVCPCVDCRNDKRFPHSMHIHAHLIMRGFKENYKIWNKHGEDGLNILETEEGDADQCPIHTEDDILSDADIEDLDEDTAADLVDNAEQMVRDAETNNDYEYTDGDFAKFQNLVRDSKTPLYPGCNTGFSVLNSVLKLLKLKATHCW